MLEQLSVVKGDKFRVVGQIRTISTCFLRNSHRVNEVNMLLVRTWATANSLVPMTIKSRFFLSQSRKNLWTGEKSKSVRQNQICEPNLSTSLSLIRVINLSNVITEITFQHAFAL